MKPHSTLLSIAILTILNIGAGNTGTSKGTDYPSPVPKQAKQTGSSTKGSPPAEPAKTPAPPPATAPAVAPPVDLDASIKQQEFENQKLVALKTQLEIKELKRSEWMKPSTLFSIFTTLAVVAGAYISYGWSRSSYERAQASFERAQGNAERYKFEADRAKEDRDKAKVETDALINEKEKTLAATTDLKAQIAKLESQQVQINVGIHKAAIRLVATGDPYELRNDAILGDILDSLHVSIIFVTNVSDEPVYFGIGSMKIPGEAGLSDWDAAMAARKQFTSQPSTQTSDEPPTYYEHVQPHQTVRFVIPRKAAHNTLSGGFMKPGQYPRGYSGPVYYFTNESYGRIAIIEFAGRFRKMIDPGVSPEYDPLSH